MNILFITPRIPYPPYRGDKLHVYNLVRRLAARHRVGLVTFVESEAERAHVEPLAEHCSYIRVTHLSKWTSLLNVASVLFDRTPFQVAYYRSRAFAASVREAVAAFQPDIVHSHLIRTVQYTRGIEGIPRVLGLTDAVSLYLQRFADQEGNPLKRALVRMELARIVRYESVAADFDRALVCSATDRAVILNRAPRADVGILYNGVDLDSFTPRDDIAPEPGRIIFTGNMTYFPNIDAVEWLLAEIFPAVKRRVPHARLYVVGQNPPRAMRARASADVVVTGFVPDIAAEYQKSAVAVSPVRFGAGTLNKVLEPIALGVPVVATPIGFPSLGMEAGRDIEIADDAASFADKVATLLEQPARARAMAAEGARRVRERFSWDAITRDLEDHYAAAIDRFRTRTGEAPAADDTIGR